MDSENEVTDEQAGTSCHSSDPCSERRATWFTGPSTPPLLRRARDDRGRGKAPLGGGRRHGADDGRDPAIRRDRDAGREDRTARRTIHAHPVGARGVVERVDRGDGEDRCSGAPGARRVARSSLRRGDRLAAGCGAPAETDARALSPPAPHAERLGRQPSARAAGSALDRQRGAGSEHAWQDGQGARRRRASRHGGVCVAITRAPAGRS